MSKSIFICFLLYLALAQSAYPQRLDSLTLQKIHAFYQETNNGSIYQGFTSPLTDSTEKQWIKALWRAEFFYRKDALVYNALNLALDQFQKLNPGTQREVFEGVYTLFPSEFKVKMTELIDSVNNPKLFAMAAHYLMNNGVSKKSLLSKMALKFADINDNPILTMLYFNLKASKEKQPPLRDLLYQNFFNMPVLFSIQSANRDYPGFMIIRKDSIHFLKNPDGSLFSVKQIACSIANMPGYLTNGNTPQGIFSFQGYDTSANLFIGPTTNMQMVLPFEVSASEYFHYLIDTGKVFDSTMYANLLPTAWRNYTPLYEAFYAGKAGRNSIIIHGATIDTTVYSGLPYAPLSPTAGCLSNLEVWDLSTGELLFSDQKKLADALRAANISKGFVVVINVHNKNRYPVLKDIEQFLK